MELTRTHKIIIVSVAIVGSFALGRWATPERIKIETKTVEIERKTEDNKSKEIEKKNIKIITKEETRADGTKTITTTTQDESTTETLKHDISIDEINKSTDTIKEVTNSSSKTTISLMAGADVTNIAGGISYGLSVSRPILGPLTIGAFGMSNKTGGVSVGITF